jgi:hypothetical protein
MLIVRSKYSQTWYVLVKFISSYLITFLKMKLKFLKKDITWNVTKIAYNDEGNFKAYVDI